ncbi:MAG: hypothetical protein L3J92_02050 [Thermoplasmata archaeon]|jgi:hypothetical protein|nr:hypothetical protein [Thermoplasmata archaeon]
MNLLPPLDLTVAFLPFAVVAISMVGVTIFVLTQLLPRSGGTVPLTSMTFGLSLLAGSSILLLALLWVFIDPNGTTAWTWVLVAFNFMMMGPAGLWFVSLIVFRDRAVDARSWVWPAVIALATVGSEVLMGVLFAVGGGNAPTTIVGGLALGLSSLWFDWSMGAIMVALLLWVPLTGLARGSLAALTAAAFLAPWVVAVPLVGAAGMGLLMTSVFVLVYRQLAVRTSLGATDLRIPFGLAVAFALMIASQVAVVAAPGSDLAALSFGGTMALVMSAEVAFVLHRSLDSYHTDIKRVQVARALGAV